MKIILYINSKTARKSKPYK